jgi:peptidoglycan-associated lipoprotein
MFVIRRSSPGLVVFVATALAVLAPALYATSVMAQSDQAQSDPSQSNEQPASEMLQDGLDALEGHDNALATQLFEQLILTYPGTSEAERAERELRQAGTAARPRDQLTDGGGKEIAALRMQLAKDTGDRVFFAENSAIIGGRARALLENQARWLAARPDLKVTIIGRADDGGPENEAQLLSAKRAEAVRDRLVAGGIPATRIMIDARGTRDPVATCRTPMCQAQNRNAETSVGGVIMTGAGGDEIYQGASGRNRGGAMRGAEGGVTVSR